jgi:ribosomal-protein-alanine N-acetyltransferase
MPQVLEIEEACFIEPWDEEDVVKRLHVRNCIGMVVEDCEQVAAYMMYELYKTHFNVLRMAVHPDFRYEGKGRQMIKQLADKLTLQRRSKIIFAIHEQNLDAQLWLQACGLVCVEIVGDEYIFEYDYEMECLFNGDQG